MMVCHKVLNVAHMTSTLQIWKFESEPPQIPQENSTTSQVTRRSSSMGKTTVMSKQKGRRGLKCGCKKSWVVIMDLQGSLRTWFSYDLRWPDIEGLSDHPRLWKKSLSWSRKTHTHTDISEGLSDMQTFNIDGFWMIKTMIFLHPLQLLRHQKPMHFEFLSQKVP